MFGGIFVRKHCALYIKRTVKGKVIPEPKHHGMEVYREAGPKTLHILDLSTRWRRVVIFKFLILSSEKNWFWYLLDWRLGGSENWSGHAGKE